MATTDPPLPWRRRADLLTRPQGAHWVLKDPVAQRHFQLGREAFFVWEQLDGDISVAELCAAFRERFAPRVLTLEQLQSFLNQLIQQGLVWGDRSGLAAITERRRVTAAAQRTWSTVLGLLSIRFRGIDPDRWLTPLARVCGGIFSPAAVTAGLLAILSAIVLWMTHASEFARRIPEDMARWQVGDVVSFALVLACLKVLHELGHGIACKRYGGEVRELGVMLLVFTPCLYCNVSDAWLLRSRWQRMVISAAGVWVESVIAAACIWLWWLSEPGWFHATCLQIVLIATVSTLLFNLNPLLRYDGYFLLSDLWGIPNLQQRASQELQRRLKKLCGLSSEPRPFGLSTARALGLTLYAVAAFVYRVLLVLTILWLIDSWLEPQGLRAVSQTIAALTLGTLVLGPLLVVRRWIRDPDSRPAWQIDRPHRLVLTTILLAVVLLTPFPSRVQAPAILMPAEARGLFVTIPGRLDEIVAPGTVVAAGDVVARLSNPGLQRDLERAESEVALARLRLTNLQRRQISDPRVAWQLPAAERHLQDVEAQWAERRDDAARLTIRAPQAGVVWPVPARGLSGGRERLPDWSGSPFAAENLGSWQTVGTQLGWVGQGDQLEAMAVVSQTAAARVSPGMTARLVATAARDRPLAGRVERVSDTRLDSFTPDLTRRLQLPEINEERGSRLVGSWYQLRITLEDRPPTPVVLGVGTVSIQAPPESLIGRGVRWVRETIPALR